MDKAIFINLDNTLITTQSRQPYALHSKDWQVTNDIIKYLVAIHKKGYKIIIISNQHQIRYGLTSKEAFEAKLNDICLRIETARNLGNKICYEYCYEEDSFNYMPNPGMFYTCALEYELSLKKSIMIGCDNIHKLAAMSSGIGNYYDISEIQNIV